MQQKKIQCNPDSHLAEKQVIKTFARAYPAKWLTEEEDLEAELGDRGININGYALIKVLSYPTSLISPPPSPWNQKIALKSLQPGCNHEANK